MSTSSKKEKAAQAAPKAPKAPAAPEAPAPEAPAPEAPAPEAKGPEAKAPKTPAAGPFVGKLIVTSQVAGFRRGGRAWPAEPVTVDLADFTETQIEQILAEPLLTVVPVAE